MSLRMVLRSTDSSEYFENKPSCFRIQLNKQVQLDGYWTIGLTEFTTERWKSNKKSQEVFICCDMCEETFVGGKDMPLLRRVYLNGKKGNQHNLRSTLLRPCENRSITTDLHIYNRWSRQLGVIL